MKTRTHTLITTGFAVALSAVAVVGGLHGNAMQAEAAEQAAASARVSAFVNDVRATQIAHAETQAAEMLEAFQPTLDDANALVKSSEGKASAESRKVLADLVVEFETKTDPDAYRDVFEHRFAVETMTSSATPAFEKASKTVADEVSAWQKAEDERVAAEQAAAEEAARQAEQESYDGWDDGGDYSDGGGSSDSGSYSAGGSSTADQWRAIAASYGVGCFRVIPGNVSYYIGGCIEIGEAPLNAGAERVLFHEIAHHMTIGSFRSQCAYKSTDLLGYSSMEVWAQAYTQLYFGWSMPQYESASQSYIDGMVAAGCL